MAGENKCCHDCKLQGFHSHQAGLLWRQSSCLYESDLRSLTAVHLPGDQNFSKRRKVQQRRLWEVKGWDNSCVWTPDHRDSEADRQSKFIFKVTIGFAESSYQLFK